MGRRCAVNSIAWTNVAWALKNAILKFSVPCERSESVPSSRRSRVYSSVPRRCLRASMTSVPLSMIPLKNFGSSSDTSEGGSDGGAAGGGSGRGGTGGNAVVLDGAPGPNAHHSQPAAPPAMTEQTTPIIKYRLRILLSVLPNSPFAVQRDLTPPVPDRVQSSHNTYEKTLIGSDGFRRLRY
jgi:hypothetical protein